jgi:hypothetical protein
MSNTLSQKSLNMWRNATLVNPTLSGTATFTGTIVLPAASGLKYQSVSGFVATIVSATAAIVMIPVLITGTLTSIAIAANAATVTGPATFTFSRITGGVTTAITDGVVSIATTDTAGVYTVVLVSQAFLSGDTLKVVVGGTNTAAGTAGIAAKITVA